LIDGLERNLVQAGHPHNLDLPRMLGLKVTLGGIVGMLLVIAGEPVWAAVAAVVVFFMPDYWVLTERDKRQAAIQSETADTIDQMTICVEAGLGFDAALARVATANNGVLAQELRRTLGDIQAGMSRSQALRMLADRVQIQEVRQIVTALLQAQKHGVPLAETLRTQSAEMRLKRKQRTEEKAAKLTVKMLFPIVVCFLPVFFVITMGPALMGLGDTF
jgi:tight adherence protein C